LFEYLAFLFPYVLRFKYFAIFGALVIAGFGIPIPEEATLILSGYMVSQGLLEFATTLTVCYLGVIGGDLVTYAMGRYGGRWMLGTRFSRWLIPRQRLSDAQFYYGRYGPRFLLLARQIPGLRFPAFFTAGMLKMVLSRFLIYDSLAALISMPVVLLISIYFGSRLNQTIELVTQIGDYATFVVGGFIVCLLVGYLIYRAFNRKTQGKNA